MNALTWFAVIILSVVAIMVATMIGELVQCWLNRRKKDRLKW